jgi:preprotein translocase subunit SecD
MIYYPRWKIILVLLVCLIGGLYAAPNAFDRNTVQEWSESVPAWVPGRQINLGLDLQGGSHLLLRVEYEVLVSERLEATMEQLRTLLRAEDIGYTGLTTNGDALQVDLRDAGDAAAVRTLITEYDEDFAVDIDGAVVRGMLSEAGMERLRVGAVDQAIEIVRRRVDEFGTVEPTIQRQGEDRIIVQLPGIEDPERIKELLGQTARLTFHMLDEGTTVQEARDGRLPAGSMLLPSDELGPDGDPVQDYVVRRRVMVSGETLTDAQPTFQDGQPVVSFRFDSVGGRRFGEVTQENVGRFLAIVLDDAVISAPRINSPILGGRGIITGQFTVEAANDLSILLRAGALPAPLTVLEERTVGPGLGEDSIAAGQIASVVGFLLVIAFMSLTYGLLGIMASVALVMNLALLVAALSALQATLTLPGIAGIVLTVGMAVDANVLIFERIREEQRAGRTPISAVDAGYSRALTTIIDSNLTTLIAAALLFALGTGPVRGFAVTLSIGIVCSMFTAMMVTRLFVVTWLRRTRPKAIPI